MLNRDLEKSGMFDMLQQIGVGGICFSPLAQGVLSGKYLNGIPEKSRASRDFFLKKDSLTPDLLEKISKLNAIAKRRSQSLSQMALAWLLSRGGVTSVLCGASSPEQISELAQAPVRCAFSQEEYDEIDSIIYSKIKYSN